MTPVPGDAGLIGRISDHLRCRTAAGSRIKIHLRAARYRSVIGVVVLHNRRGIEYRIGFSGRTRAGNTISIDASRLGRISRRQSARLNDGRTRKLTDQLSESCLIKQNHRVK